MQYHHSRILESTIEQMTARVREALDAAGFGVLTSADMSVAFEKQLGIQYRRYVILGACNAPYSKRAIEAERWIGTMLPCNIVIQDADEGQVEVSAIDPVAALQIVENPEISAIAAEVRETLFRVIDTL